MKTPLEDDIETQSDAATFYYAIVVENGIVIDADKGFSVITEHLSCPYKA